MSLSDAERLRKLVSFFETSYKLSTDKSNIVIDGIRYNKSQFTKEFNKDKCYELNWKSLAKKDDSNIKRIMEKLHDLLIEKFKAERSQILQTFCPPELGVNPGPEECMNLLTPIIELSTNKILIVDTETCRITDMHFDVWARLCGLSDNDKKKLNIRQGKLVYNPLSLDSIRKEDYLKMSIVAVNTYTPPNWQLKTVGPPTKPFAFPLVDRFFSHLIPNEKCRNFVFNWIKNMLIEPKNGTHLVLCGAKGIGKNVFVELLKNLVGPKNFHKAPKGFLQSQFNPILENSRLIFMDEVRAHQGEAIDTLKDYANIDQNIQRKGIDADKTKATFCSFVLAMNREKDIYIEQDDRRFSVIDLTTARLNQVMTEDEIRELQDIFKNDEFLFEFGNWVTQTNHGVWRVDEPWTGEKFNKLVYTSLNPTKQFLLEKLKSRKLEEYPLIGLEIDFDVSSYKKRNSEILNLQTIQGFIDTFLWEGEEVGELIEKNGSWVLVPSKHFLPEVNGTQNHDGDIDAFDL